MDSNPAKYGSTDLLIYWMASFLTSQGLALSCVTASFYGKEPVFQRRISGSSIHGSVWWGNSLEIHLYTMGPCAGCEIALSSLAMPSITTPKSINPPMQLGYCCHLLDCHKSSSNLLCTNQWVTPAKSQVLPRSHNLLQNKVSIEVPLLSCMIWIKSIKRCCYWTVCSISLWVNSFRTSKKQSRMCFLYSNLCRNSYTILRNPWISWMTLSQDRRISWLTSLWLGWHDSLGWGCRTALHGGWHSEPTNFPWPWAGHRDVGPVEQKVPKYLGKLW